jgi:glucose dehydrogenase
MNYLYALDPATGRPVSEFGEGGAIDLRKDLAGDFHNHYVSLTSPGMIYRNLIIVGFRTSESEPAPPGDIRAYDVRTGRLVWSFHTIPRPGEPGIQTWPPNAWQHGGSANNWAGFALDARRGIVYAPTGSAVSDFYGADRLGGVASGIFRLCITIFGIGIFHRLLLWSRCTEPAGRWTLLPSQPSRVISISSIAPAERRYSPSRKYPIHPVTCLGRWRRRRSLVHSRLSPLRVNG